MKKLNELLEIMKEHQKLDRLVQGNWLSDEEVQGSYRGCFFGCAMQTSNNAIKKACEKYGLPLWIGYWSESVFEGLEVEDAVKWPVQLLEALINFSGDTEKLMHDLAIKRLTNLLPTKNQEVNSAIELVIDYHKNPDEQKRIAAESAACSVRSAWSAACSALSALSAAESAACSACSAESAESASESALSAAWSAWHAAGSVARSAVWSAEKDYMLELLRE